MPTFEDLAGIFFTSVHAAERGSVDAEPEAQLTVPFSELVRGVGELAGLKRFSLIRETRQDGIRPDFAILYGKRFGGWAELKAPDVTVDGARWTGRNAKQWSVLRSLDALIVCNGRMARLYAAGDVYGSDAPLPYDSAEAWDPEPLVALLRRFVEAKPLPITSVNDLARRLAARTRDLRERLLWVLASEGEAAETAKRALAAWRSLIHPACTEKDFCDGASQVVAYGMVMAVLTTDADVDEDGVVTVGEARNAIRASSPIMAAAFGPLLDNPVLADAVRVELGALELLISAVDPVRVNKSADRRGEPWLYFYEDFLAEYDPDERKQAGVYYTPTQVVEGMVRFVDHLLVERFHKRLGFADPSVVTLDPATGTGTFPLSVLNHGGERAQNLRGEAGQQQAAKSLEKTLFAFEILPGPYAVAHLRLGLRIRKMDEDFSGAPQVVLTDTLESPEAAESQVQAFGDADLLAIERDRARQIKRERRVTVVIGNPPYRRVKKSSSGPGGGSWILKGTRQSRGKGGRSLFDDILDVAKAHTIFSHQASLYNLYVFFWRWAIWKAFEAHGPGPGVVAFITASSWLDGPGFMGLRQLVREVCDEAWVLDLGGDNKGANPEENVFAIETPVAIVVMVRDQVSDKQAMAPVHYRRITGTREEKLGAMDRIAAAVDPLVGDWEDAPNEPRAPFVPHVGGTVWDNMPLLKDIFPWQQPGCKFNRLWPIAPSSEDLALRWERFVSADRAEKERLFQTADSGRNIFTQVGTLRPLAELVPGAAHRPIARYGYRSFDRQWAFNDPRLAALDRPALWQSRSDKQVFLASLMTGGLSAGPAMTVTPHTPDLHYFVGHSGGKDIIPLYRDIEARRPNVTSGLLGFIGTALAIPTPTPEDLASYVYSILSSPRFQARFPKELSGKHGIHLPITANASTWSEAVAKGRYLLWLHTYGERFRDEAGGRGRYVPGVAGLGWRRPVTKMPIGSDQVGYSAADRELVVGDGRVSGVDPSSWGYSVSGMQIVKKWLGYRTMKGAGRAAISKNPLDKIRDETWHDEWNDELLDLLRVLTLTVQQQPEQADLVDRICDGALVPASILPKPTAAERRPPPTAPIQ
ncbi:MAG: N-6 DNA methylase [Thermoleophilia bacterium]|nr:N-6 DNA methylase [Thermoleophilia bacterium]